MRIFSRVTCEEVALVPNNTRGPEWITTNLQGIYDRKGIQLSAGHSRRNSTTVSVGIVELLWVFRVAYDMLMSNLEPTPG